MSSDTWFDAAGPSDAPAIVLVHGSVVTRQMWLPQLRGLSDRYRVLAPDLPGHGALADLPFSFDAAVQRSSELIAREARGGRALVVGASLGGYVALELAHRHPEQVAGLVLAGAFQNFTSALRVYLRVVGALMRRGLLQPSRRWLEAKTLRLFPPEQADAAEAQLRAGLYPQALGPALLEMAARDFLHLLSAFAGPTLLLGGAGDSSSRRGALRFVAAARRGYLRVLPNAGHACSLEQPDAFNQAVCEFARVVYGCPD